MMKIFPKHWPAPSKMSRPQYMRYRLKMLAFLIFWGLFIATGIFFWDQLHILLKGLFIVLGYVIYPTIDILEQLFTSYDKYLQEGLW